MRSSSINKDAKSKFSSFGPGSRRVASIAITARAFPNSFLELPGSQSRQGKTSLQTLGYHGHKKRKNGSRDLGLNARGSGCRNFRDMSFQNMCLQESRWSRNLSSKPQPVACLIQAQPISDACSIGTKRMPSARYGQHWDIHKASGFPTCNAWDTCGHSITSATENRDDKQLPRDTMHS